MQVKQRGPTAMASDVIYIPLSQIRRPTTRNTELSGRLRVEQGFDRLRLRRKLDDGQACPKSSLLGVTAANVMGLASLLEEPLDEFSDEDFS
jgi:hypothetical protein